MNPTQQTSEWLQQVNVFFTNLREAGPLIGLIGLLIIAAFVYGITKYLDYRLRSTFAKRDSERTTAQTAESERQDLLLSKMVDMYGSFTEAIKESKEDLAASITVFKITIEKMTETQANGNVVTEALTTAIKALDGRSGSTQMLLEQHDKQAADGIKNIIVAVERVETKVDSALKHIGEMKAFFPDGSTPLAKIEKELAEAIEALKDCAKRATDEKPIVTLPAPDAADSEAA